MMMMMMVMVVMMMITHDEEDVHNGPDDGGANKEAQDKGDHWTEEIMLVFLRNRKKYVNESNFTSILEKRNRGQKSNLGPRGKSPVS